MGLSRFLLLSQKLVATRCTGLSHCPRKMIDIDDCNEIPVPYPFDDLDAI